MITLEEVIGTLKVHEDKLKARMVKREEKALLAKAFIKEKKKDHDPSNGTGRGQGRGRGRSRNNPRNSEEDEDEKPKDKSKVTYYNCQGKGHFANECRKPKKERLKKDSQEKAHLAEEEKETTLLMAIETSDEVLLQGISQCDLSKGMGYIHRGASGHMTGGRELICDLDDSYKGIVRFGDGSKISIEGKGKIILNSKDNTHITLKNVLYTPSLKANILSLDRLDEDGYDIRLHKGFLTNHDDRGFLLTKVQRSSGRMYPLKLDIIEHCLQISEDLTWLWHKRYGHLNLASLKILSSQNLVKGLPTIHKREELCSSCVTSKQAIQSFPSSAKFRASRPLELIHGDLCGPFAAENLGGSKYFLLLLDDCTRMLWVSLLKQKLEAFEAFKSFKAQAEREKELKLICLRTNNGGEFTSKEFISFCSEHRI